MSERQETWDQLGNRILSKTKYQYGLAALLARQTFKFQPRKGICQKILRLEIQILKLAK